MKEVCSSCILVMSKHLITNKVQRTFRLKKYTSKSLRVRSTDMILEKVLGKNGSKR